MKRIWLFTIAFLLVASLAISAPTTDTSTVSWIAPTTNTDGSVLTDLDGFKVYYGTAPGVYDGFITVGKEVTSYQFTGLSDNTTYYYSVVAFDIVDIDSEHSIEVNRIINFTVTNTATGVAVGP